MLIAAWDATYDREREIVRWQFTGTACEVRGNACPAFVKRGVLHCAQAADRPRDATRPRRA
jgi:hypothetical protein